MRELAARIAIFIAATCLLALIAIALAEVILPKLARATTLFVATPGGFVVALLTWRYLSRKQKH